MPKAPPKPCNRYRCPNMATKDGYCDDHWEPRWARYERGAKIYDLSVWKKFRANYLRRHPICNRCRHAATVPHHIDPVDNGGAIFDEDNLEPLCRNCHEIEHGRMADST